MQHEVIAARPALALAGHQPDLGQVGPAPEMAAGLALSCSASSAAVNRPESEASEAEKTTRRHPARPVSNMIEPIRSVKARWICERSFVLGRVVTAVLVSAQMRRT